MEDISHVRIQSSITLLWIFKSLFASSFDNMHLFLQINNSFDASCFKKMFLSSTGNQICFTDYFLHIRQLERPPFCVCVKNTYIFAKCIWIRRCYFGDCNLPYLIWSLLTSNIQSQIYAGSNKCQQFLGTTWKSLSVGCLL